MKKYNHTNFFKYTFCEFQEIDDFEFPNQNYFKSKSESAYFYTEEGVYRKSNHWGKVANCRWKLISNKKYKNQQTVIGFAKWKDFYPINSDEKCFFIHVDFENKTATIHPKRDAKTNHLYHFLEAQEKSKKINALLKNDQWTNYFRQDKEELKKLVIHEFLQSAKSIQQIKREFT